VGIAPPAFQGAVVGGSDDVWIPNMIARVAFRQMNILSRGSSGDQSPLRLVGRLRQGRTINGARAELTVLVHQLHAAHPDLHPWSEVSLYTLNGMQPQFRPEHTRLAFVLSATTTVLLLIACTNLGGLLLARGLARSQEIGAHRLGAGRSRGSGSDRGLVWPCSAAWRASSPPAGSSTCWSTTTRSSCA
jgi:hypothetical protein